MFACCDAPSKTSAAEEVKPSAAPVEQKDEPKIEVRTAKSEAVKADDALAQLKEGNERYVASQAPGATPQALRKALADDGQLPMAAVLGCADSRAPVEMIFDQKPGDIFVCRNAGNAVVQAEGSVVASMEFCVCALKTQLLVVLGHTKCGAIKGAVANIPAVDAQPSGVLDGYLKALAPSAKQAKGELPKGTSDDEVVAHAVKVNVKNTMSRILELSEPLREKVKAGELTVQGAVYDISTGRVEFLGDEPKPAAKFAPPERLSGA